MARANFGVEQGYDIYDVNGDVISTQLAGSAAPGGDTGPQDDAAIGSTYQRTDGSNYIKTADTNAASDWKLVPVELSAGYTPANGDPAIADSFEEAIEKMDANQDDIQSASGLAQGATDYGTFTGATIPDTSTSKAALQSVETAYEETDANADDLITLSGVAENATDLGTFTGTTIPDTSTNKAAMQSLETSHETLSTSVTEIDANVDDLITLSGVAENATDLGTFTGATIPDTSTNKAALQSLETAVEAISGGSEVQVTGVTTLQDVDTFLVDECQQIEWEVVVFEEATPANKKAMKIIALHDGTASADAANVDDSEFAKLKLGSNFNLVLAVDLSGAAGAQQIRLRASSSTAGVTISTRRTIIA